MADVQGFHEVGDDYRAAYIPGGYGSGYTGRDRDIDPPCTFGAPPTIKTLSQAELLERIAEKTAKKTWLSDQADRVGSPVKNQSQSSYCWFHAPTRGLELVDLAAGSKPKRLSAFYGAAQIKNGRNEGGSGIVACRWLAAHGTCLEAMHPPLPDRRAFSVDHDQTHADNAARHKLVDFEDLDPHDMAAIYTRVVLGYPVTVGIPAWGHEVLITFLVVDRGAILPGFDNSWSPDWGTNGRGVLTGAKMRFDEAGAIYTISPANG